MLHSAVLYAMSRIPDTPKKQSTIVEMTVKQQKREPPPPPPPPPKKEEVIPPPELEPKKVKVRTAKEIVKDAPPPATEKKEEPKFAFSVDMSNTAEVGSVEVPAVDGGGNMFADPEK